MMAIILFALIATLTASPALAQRPGFGQRDVIPDGSRVEYKTFQSSMLGREIRYGLYLPPSYATSAKKYPVLYFLHGLNENEMRWSTRGLTDLKLDELVKSGKSSEFVVAIPFGAISFYTNFRSGAERWEDMIVREFIPMIESTVRIDAGRRNRGISGISMGGFGALKIAWKNPEMFGAVSAHSVVLLKDFSAATIGGRRMDMLSQLFDRIFGISQDLDYWNGNNPLKLAEDTRKFNGMKIYFDCGTEDDYGFAAGTKLLSEILTRTGYPHEWHLYPGDHGWDYAKQHTEASLLFHSKAFQGK